MSEFSKQQRQKRSPTLRSAEFGDTSTSPDASSNSSRSSGAKSELQQTAERLSTTAREHVSPYMNTSTGRYASGGGSSSLLGPCEDMAVASLPIRGTGAKGTSTSNISNLAAEVAIGQTPASINIKWPPRSLSPNDGTEEGLLFSRKQSLLPISRTYQLTPGRVRRSLDIDEDGKAQTVNAMEAWPQRKPQLSARAMSSALRSAMTIADGDTHKQSTVHTPVEDRPAIAAMNALSRSNPYMENNGQSPPANRRPVGLAVAGVLPFYTPNAERKISSLSAALDAADDIEVGLAPTAGAASGIDKDAVSVLTDATSVTSNGKSVRSAARQKSKEIAAVLLNAERAQYAANEAAYKLQRTQMAEEFAMQQELLQLEVTRQQAAARDAKAEATRLQEIVARQSHPATHNPVVDVHTPVVVASAREIQTDGAAQRALEQKRHTERQAYLAERLNYHTEELRPALETFVACNKQYQRYQRSSRGINSNDETWARREAANDHVEAVLAAVMWAIDEDEQITASEAQNMSIYVQQAMPPRIHDTPPRARSTQSLERQAAREAARHGEEMAAILDTINLGPVAGGLSASGAISASRIAADESDDDMPSLTGNERARESDEDEPRRPAERRTAFNLPHAYYQRKDAAQPHQSSEQPRQPREQRRETEEERRRRRARAQAMLDHDSDESDDLDRQQERFRRTLRHQPPQSLLREQLDRDSTPPRITSGGGQPYSPKSPNSASGTWHGQETGDTKAGKNSRSAKTILAASQIKVTRPSSPEFHNSKSRATDGLFTLYVHDATRHRQQAPATRDKLGNFKAATQHISDLLWDGNGATLATAINKILQTAESLNLQYGTVAQHLASGEFMHASATKTDYVEDRANHIALNNGQATDLHWLPMPLDDAAGCRAWLILIIQYLCDEYRVHKSLSQLRAEFATLRLTTPNLSGLGTLLRNMTQNFAQRSVEHRDNEEFTQQWQLAVQDNGAPTSLEQKTVNSEYKAHELAAALADPKIAVQKRDDPRQYCASITKIILKDERDRLTRIAGGRAASTVKFEAPDLSNPPKPAAVAPSNFRNFRNRSATIGEGGSDEIAALQEMLQIQADAIENLGSWTDDIRMKAQFTEPMTPIGQRGAVDMSREPPAQRDTICSGCGRPAHRIEDCRKCINNILSATRLGETSLNLEQNISLATAQGQLKNMSTDQRAVFIAEAKAAREKVTAANQLRDTTRRRPVQPNSYAAKPHDRDAVKNACFQFQKYGQCKNGDKCRFVHAEPIKISTGTVVQPESPTATQVSALLNMLQTGEQALPQAKSTMPTFLSLEEQNSCVGNCAPLLECMRERVISNGRLIYMPVTLSRIEESRDTLAVSTGAICAVTKEERESVRKKTTNVDMAVQIDNGAATTSISLELARRLGAKEIKRQSGFRMSGFTGAQTAVDSFVNVMLYANGTATDGTPIAFKKAIQAQVIKTEFPDDIIIGADDIDNLRISTHFDQPNTLTILSDTQRTINVRCVQSGELVTQLRVMHRVETSTPVIKLNRAVVTNSTDGLLNGADQMDADVRKGSFLEATEMSRPATEKSFSADSCSTGPQSIFSIDTLLDGTERLTRPEAVKVIQQRVSDQAHDFVQAITQPFSALMMEGLIHIAQQWELQGVSEPLQTLKNVCRSMQHGRGSDATEGVRYLRKTIDEHFGNVRDLTRAAEACQGIELTLLVESASRRTNEQDALILKLHAASISTAVTDILSAEDKLLAECKESIDEWRDTHCADDPALEQFRPELFPPELWKLVDNVVKPFVKAEWEAFDVAALPTIIEQALAIDIASKTACQLLEKPIFQAQILANIRAFFQIDPDNPAMIEMEKVHIRLVKGAQPFNVKMRQECVVAQAFLRAKVASMYRTKKLQASISPWNNPVMCVPKVEEITAFYKDFGIGAFDALWDPANKERVATLYRLTGDYRLLNRDTVYEVFPLPLIQNLLHRMAGASRYSVTDIQDAFWTIPLDDESKEYTAFSTTDGHHEYNCLMQGGKNAGNVFAKEIFHRFLPLANMKMFPYQDDINNYESRLIGHMMLWQQIFAIVKKGNMVFKPAKTHMNYPEMKILGHVMSAAGRRADPSLIRAVTDLAPPTDITGVRSVLGLIQVIREYFPGMNVLVAPIQALTKKGVNIKESWTSECEASFANIKRILTSLPVLMIPDPSKPFYIHVDACRVGRGLGGVLLQRGPLRTLQPVAYWSRGLTDGERKYSATELECTALHDIILHFRTFLQNGLSFDVTVDHYALVYMVLKPSGDPHLRLDRLCLDLQGFSFRITHRSGKSHLDADFISRMLRNGEQPYVHTADTLRTDRFVSEEDRNDLIRSEHVATDASVIIGVMNEHACRDPQHVDDSLGPRTTATTFVEDPPAAEVLQQIAEWKAKYPQIIKDHSAVDALMIIGIMEEQEVARITTEAENTLSKDEYINTLCKQPVVELDPQSVVSMHAGVICEAEQLSTTVLIQRIISSTWSLDVNTTNSVGLTAIVERLIRNPVLFITLCEAVYSPQFVSGSSLNPTQLDNLINGTADIYYQMYRSLSKIRTAHATTSLKSALARQQFLLGLRQAVGLVRGPAYEQAVLWTLGENLWNDMKEQRESNSLTHRNACDVLITLPDVPWGTITASPPIDTHVDTLDFSRVGQTSTVLADITRSYAIANISTETLTLASQINATENRPSAALELLLHREILRRQDRQRGPIRRLSMREILESNAAIVDIVATPTSDRSDVVNRSIIRFNAGRYDNMVVRDYSSNMRRRVQAPTPITATDFLRVERKEKHDRQNRLKQQKQVEPSEKTIAKAVARLQEDEADERKEAIQEDDNHVLADFDWLVMLELMYKLPLEDVEHLCQVINVFRDTKRDQFMATVRVIMDGVEDRYSAEHCFILPIMDYKGAKGCISLVNDFGSLSSEPEGQVWPTTSKEWLEIQQADPQWSVLLERISSDSIVVATGGGHHGELCRIIETNGELGPLMHRTVHTITRTRDRSKLTSVTTHLKLVVPTSHVKLCLRLHHESMGHPGRNRTALTIAIGYWWITLKRDVVNHTKGCRGCALRKAYNGRAKVPVQTYDIMSYPFQRVHSDLAGPFNKTARGNQYILVIKCAITKTVAIKPIIDKTAEVVVKAAVEYFQQMGFPSMWITDRGKEADNIQWMRQLKKLLGFYHIMTTPANPRSDGQAESSMGPLKDTLSQIVNKFQDNWDDFCAQIAADYNQIVCPQTGHTPNYLLFGRELLAPSEDFLDTPVIGKISDYVKGLRETLQFGWQNAGERVVDNVTAYNAIPKERLVFKPYTVGQWFYIRRVPKRFFKSKGDKKVNHLVAKLQMRYCGPYRITKVINPVLYEADIHNTIKRVHAVNMKPA